jgi:CarboxypepD_reg-like domain
MLNGRKVPYKIMELIGKLAQIAGGGVKRSFSSLNCFESGACIALTLAVGTKIRFMRIGFFLIVLLFIGFSAKAQLLTITSKAVDAETQEPLPFASIGIKGKAIGTITNLQGEFDFHFSGEFREEVFVISMMGYTNYEIPIRSILESKPAIISLTKSNTILSTLIIKDSLRGGDILRIALRRIDENYPGQPFSMDGFYRDVKKVGNTYVSLLEAAIKIYDDNYKEPRNKSKLRERVSLMEVRRSLGYGNKFTTYFDQDNLLEVLLLNNDVRYHLFPREELFFTNMKRDKDSYYNGHDVFVVSHVQDFFLKVFIDKKTYGILHVEYQNDIPEDLGKKHGLIRKFESMKRVVDFKLYDGKFYLNYLTVDYRVNWYDTESNKLKFETLLSQQLLINRVSKEVVEKIPQKMRSYGLQYHDLPYNKKFWDDYNVIKESPLDKQIIEDLELIAPLEKQFEKN